jgi:ParB family chromosome partitioning protein
MQVEWHQLDMKYEHLRVQTPGRRSRLATSLLEHGQQAPVLVVASGDDQYVLIDGYARVGALKALGRDLVEAVVLDLSEADALVVCFRMETSRRRSALEDAWLLTELAETHGMSQQQIAARLQRSVSWVSRRLSLVRVLPAGAQQAIKAGVVPAHAAMKCLVPLARANCDQCERLVGQLGTEPISVRQMERLYEGWRSGDEEQRERIAGNPLLYLRADEQTAGPADPVEEEAKRLVADLKMTIAGLRRARRRLIEGVLTRVSPAEYLIVTGLWSDVQQAYSSLNTTIDEEEVRAGSGHPGGDPQAGPSGPEPKAYRPHPGRIEKHCQARVA